MGTESGICASTNTLNCSVLNGTITNVHSQSYCIFTGIFDSADCTNVGGNFIDCSRMNPYECFACEQVTISVKLTNDKGTADCQVAMGSLCYLDTNVQCQNRGECESTSGICSDSEYLIDIPSTLLAILTLRQPFWSLYY